jgi:hypothetical protein
MLKRIEADHQLDNQAIPPAHAMDGRLGFCISILKTARRRRFSEDIKFGTTGSGGRSSDCQVSNVSGVL